MVWGLLKEAVVGSMNSLYDSMARSENAKASIAQGDGDAKQSPENYGLSLVFLRRLGSQLLIM